MIWLKNFAKLDESELAEVYAARSDKGLLAFWGAPSVSFAEFKNIAKSADKTRFAVFDEDDFFGVIEFGNISAQGAELSFYKNPKIPRVGNTLMKEAVRYASQNLGLKFLTATVDKNNRKARSLLTRSGFVENGGTDQISMKKFITKVENEKQI